MKVLELDQMEQIEGGCNNNVEAFAYAGGIIACGFAFSSGIGALIAGPSCLGLVMTGVKCIYDE